MNVSKGRKRECIECGEEFTQGTFFIYHSAIGAKTNQTLGGVHFCRPCMQIRYKEQTRRNKNG